MKRAHVYYSGIVQGVGFRYMAEQAATALNIKGWVKNLSDGRVEVVCEGMESDIKDFLKKMEDIFGRYIKKADISWDAPTGEFKDFEVRFY